MNDEKDDEHLPVPQHDEHGDGFDQPDDQSDRTIVGLMEKFKDGDWTTGGLPADPKRRLVAVDTDVIIQRWKDQITIETIAEKPLPDIGLLNASVPRSEWEMDMNNSPRPPYQRAYLVYFLDLDTADRSTFINSTTGARIAVTRLKDKVHWMRRMRGNSVVPQVELTWVPMPTRFGVRKRPEFKVTGWLNLSGGSSVPPTPAAKQLPSIQPKQVEEPSHAEEMNDEIPF